MQVFDRIAKMVITKVKMAAITKQCIFGTCHSGRRHIPRGRCIPPWSCYKPARATTNNHENQEFQNNDLIQDVRLSVHEN